MATVTRKGFVFMVYDYTADYRDKAWQPDWRPYKPEDTEECIFIGEQELAIEVPDNFDPRPIQVAALEAQKRDLQAKFAAAVTELNTRISKLQAITYVEAAE